MAGFRDTCIEDLEARTRAAHRAYIEALSFLETVEHRATCPYCRRDEISDEEHERRYDDAHAEKERRRIVFRDLCDRLGYIALEPDIGLGPEDASNCCRPCH